MTLATKNCRSSFRPLARYIGRYIDRSIGGAYKYAYEFPASPEVDRELYFTIEPDGLITTK